ncbi:MAG: group II truncated hemoglobin [Candidatus Thiodiazotropha sp.]
MSQDQTPYERIGGEAAVRELVDRFYNLMDRQQEAKKIRDLHAKNLRISRDKLFLFLSGWLGGPDLYVEKYGHPRLRARHLPFSIGIEERDQWIYCMRKALSAMDLDAKLQEELNQAFFRTADFMRNRDEEVRDTLFRIISSGKTQ